MCGGGRSSWVGRKKIVWAVVAGMRTLLAVSCSRYVFEVCPRISVCYSVLETNRCCIDSEIPLSSNLFHVGIN